MAIDSGIAKYLTGHRIGVLATSRKSGSPQQTLIAYQFDGNNIAISVRGFSQKAKNLMRRPDASLAVVDGSTQLIVSGAVTVISDEAEVLRLNQERMRQISTRAESDAELADRLRKEERVILLLSPDRLYPTSM
ncbi:MAG TPA: pyridoxamine 5'-phosphate oxidase family protein [Dehalococcoidia bacterium]|nr:pyridoxamine 5'-phosphate oxidase family protein [Dehalococcoidia bacterium]